jgi:hypothetical protein
LKRIGENRDSRPRSGERTAGRGADPVASAGDKNDFPNRPDPPMSHDAAIDPTGLVGSSCALPVKEAGEQLSQLPSNP